MSRWKGFECEERKIVQISTTAMPGWAFLALCDDGSLWAWDDRRSWIRLSDVPQTENQTQ